MTKTVQKTSTGVKLVLALSLGLNVAVIGLIAGAQLGQDRAEDGVRGLKVRDIGLGPFMQALEQEDRREVGRQYLRTSDGPQVMRREAQAVAAEILDSLRAEPFDEAALAELLISQQTKLSERQQQGTDLVVEQITQMSAVERGEYADRLETLFRSGGPKGAMAPPPKGPRGEGPRGDGPRPEGPRPEGPRPDGSSAGSE